MFLTLLTLLAPKTIEFSGYTWDVKTSTSKVGPGPNLFGGSEKSVQVDAKGRLHMKVYKTEQGGWRCSEVVMQKSLGYGTYRFTIETPQTHLDPNLVLGLFTWSDPDAENHREIDIELSRWGNPKLVNTQFVIQPYEKPQNINRFESPKADPFSVQEFTWKPKEVTFKSQSGRNAKKLKLVKDWTYTGPDIPTHLDEQLRINLWLMEGKAPTKDQPYEVVISKFEFEPLKS